MKICQIMLAKDFGGAERYYVDLSSKLAARGHELIAISHAGSVAGRLLQATPGIEHYAVSVLGSWDPFIVQKISAILARHQPEVVQAHLARGAHIAGKATAKLQIPLLAHTHNFIKLKYYKQVDTFIPATRAQYDYLLAHGITAEKIRLIRNFSAFPPVAEIKPRKEVKTLVSHGRFVHKKGFDLLLQALARLADRQINLRLAGEGPERENLEKLMAQHNLQDRVQLAGWQDNVRDFLLPGDLFVLPSRDEPFGIAVLEAMACGLPIVAARCQGPGEVLDESCAWLCEPGNADALLAALERAINDPAGRTARARAALKLYKDKYFIEKIIPQFEETYQQTIARFAVG